MLKTVRRKRRKLAYIGRDFFVNLLSEYRARNNLPGFILILEPPTDSPLPLAAAARKIYSLLEKGKPDKFCFTKGDTYITKPKKYISLEELIKDV